MKCLHTLVLLALTVLFPTGSAAGEYRQWTDSNGATLIAEYVRKEVDSVVLRREDGAEFKVAYKSLSEPDQQFVMLRNPPRVEIKVEPNVDTYTVGYLGNGGYDYTVQYEVVEPVVMVRKIVTDLYDAPLTLEMLILGRVREIDRYLVIDSTKTNFTFTGENTYKFTCRGYPLDLQQTKGSWRSGIEYYGYLVAIRDSRDIIIAIKGSSSSLEEHADELIGASVGSMLTDDLRVVKPRRIVPEEGYAQPRLSY